MTLCLICTISFPQSSGTMTACLKSASPIPMASTNTTPISSKGRAQQCTPAFLYRILQLHIPPATPRVSTVASPLPHRLRMLILSQYIRSLMLKRGSSIQPHTPSNSLPIFKDSGKTLPRPGGHPVSSSASPLPTESRKHQIERLHCNIRNIIHHLLRLNTLPIHNKHRLSTQTHSQMASPYHHRLQNRFNRLYPNISSSSSSKVI